MPNDLKNIGIFQDLVGQKLAVTFLESAIKKKRPNNAYLFSGPEGVGRSLAAKRFLEGLITDGKGNTVERSSLESLNHPDLFWVEPTYLHQGKLVTKSNAKQEGLTQRNPPQIRLDQIRQVKTFLSRQPFKSPFAMVVIEDVESMAENAANALLKTLEEPGNGLLILISSGFAKII